MPEKSRPYRHGIHEAMSVLAGQWVTAVLASLSAKPMTYSELLDDINETEELVDWTAHGKPLSKKVLTDTLHRMQRDGLVVKIERPSTFGNTWYNLTGVGRSLLRALRPLAKWAEDNRRDVLAARSAHHASQTDALNDRR
jgi:DNA-binding HxlR family transcriptional regulator